MPDVNKNLTGEFGGPSFSALIHIGTTPLTHSKSLLYVETPILTADVQALPSDEEYAAAQQHLVAQLDCGDVITGTGGLRKIRWSATGRGKRGGTRMICYHIAASA